MRHDVFSNLRRCGRRRSPATGIPDRRVFQRRLLVEHLEDRRVLSASVAPELHGMYLVDPDVDNLRGQVVYLDYDGEEDATYNGPVTIGPFDVPAFEAPGDLAGQEDAIMAVVVERLNDLFATVEVTFTLDQPALPGTYSTVYIGGEGVWASEFGEFLGLAEKVDIGNQDPADKAYVFAGLLTAYHENSNACLHAIAELLSHETGHLLGYAHTPTSDTDSLSILEDVASTAIMLNVPYYSQGKTNWCLVTALSMVLHHYFPNDAPKIWEIADALDMDRLDGVSMPSAQSYLNNNFSNGAAAPWRLTEDPTTNYQQASNSVSVIQNIIRDGHPVIVSLPEDVHSIVVTGYSGSTDTDVVYIHDPSGTELSAQPHRQLSWETFKNELIRNQQTSLLYGNSSELFATVDSGVRPSGVSIQPTLDPGALSFTDGSNVLPIAWSGTGARPGYFYDGNPEDHPFQLAIPGAHGDFAYNAKQSDMMDWPHLSLHNYSYAVDYSVRILHEIRHASTQALVAVRETPWMSVSAGWSPLSDESLPAVSLAALSPGVYVSKVTAFGYPDYETVASVLDSFFVYFGVTASHTINATSGNNGRIEPAGSISVVTGDSITFRAIPDTNYVVDKWYVGGQEIPAVQGWSELYLSDVSGDGSVLVTFKPTIASGINVTSPSGGSYDFGARMPVTWLETSVSGDVKIYLYKGENRILPALADAVPVTDRQALVRLPGSSDITEGTDYRLKIISLSDLSVEGYSNYFEIRDIVISEPIVIDTKAKLQQIGSEVDGYSCSVDYVLTTDLNFSLSERFEPLCQAVSFNGTFDGGGHKIIDLWIDQPDLSKVGLFSRGSSSAVVKNLTLEDCTVEGLDTVGAIAGEWDGLMLDVHVFGDVRGTEAGGHFIGGLVGENDGTIRNSSVEGSATVSAAVEGWGSSVGGIVGWNRDNGVLEWCYVRGVSVFGDWGTENDVGGIVGTNYGLIRECYYAPSTRQPIVNGVNAVGGIVGYHAREGVIQDSYTIGEVRSDYDDVGGIAGETQAGSSIARTFSIGPVDRDGGRLVGQHYGSVEASFWDSSITGPTVVKESGSGTLLDCAGLPTSQLKQRLPFETAGWDFENVWTIQEGVSYPTLRGTGPSLNVNPSGVAASDGVPGRVTVSWNPVASAAAYGVYRSDNDGATHLLLGYSSTPTFEDRTGAPGIPYLYYVTAALTIRGAGESDVKKANSDVGYSVFQSARPVGVTATSNLKDSILVEWPAVVGASYFRVWRSTTEDGVKTAVSEWMPEHSWLDTATTMGTDYYYWVQSSSNSTGTDASEYSDFAIGREAAPVLWIEPAQQTIDFGRLSIGETIPKPVTISNVGNGTLTVHEVSGATAPFTTAPTNESSSTDDWTIEPGASLTFWVVYSPAAAGSHSGVLTLISNDPLNASYAIVLEGSGNAPPSISSLLANPDSVTRPEELILTAQGVNDDDGYVARVEFSRDDNRNGIWDTGDALLGTDINGSDGWTWAGSTAGWPLGRHTLFARAQDDAETWSEPVNIGATVSVVSWHNPDDPFDVNADGSVESVDVLLLVNEINRNESPLLPPRGVEHQQLPYFDVNEDGYLTPLDVLLVISFINISSNPPAAAPDGSGEGESATEQAYSVQVQLSPIVVLMSDRPEELWSSKPDATSVVQTARAMLVRRAFEIPELLDIEQELPDWETLLDDRPPDYADLDAYFGKID